ncbi:nucleoid-associated protein [Shewanella fidelis]|uniref:nucleoid-associated protein n=1 Tax=Shewanella fidelis TaxID=173509 RepID=UPI00048FA60C|nr:nucleoid-associated protein [Shewanella fidelis]
MRYMNTNCYHIDIQKGTYAEFKGNASSTQNFQQFAKEAVKHTQEANNAQEFIFNDSSLVQSEFLTYREHTPHWGVMCDKFSAELLDQQQVSQKSIDHLRKKVTPGSLLIIHCKPDINVDLLILVKMEQEEFANVIDFKHEYGLPTEKKALNTALIRFEKGQPTSLFVSRTNAFWIKFLDIYPVRSDNINTANAFTAIDTALKKVKHEGFKADHLALRNHLITYLRNNQGKTVVYSDLIATIFEAHSPLDENFQAKDFANSLRELPKKKTGKLAFDPHFQIDMKDVKAKKRTTSISLTDKIELSLKDGIENLDETIKPYEEDGRKGIVVFSDEGFEHFITNESEK